MFAVSLVNILTVSPITPSIEPDNTSFTVSDMDDEVFGEVALVCALANP